MDAEIRDAAFVGDQEKLIQLLSNNEAVADAVDEDLTSPLMLASAAGKLECVKLLVKRGAFVNARRCTGTSALFVAAQYGKYDVIKFLLGKGALLEAQSNANIGGIYFRLLWEINYDLKVISENGATPLFIAAQTGHLQAVRVFCEKGANVNLSMKDRTTPLFVASQNGHQLVVEYLIKYNADIESRREDGVSPLWIAVQMGRLSVVETLLKAGANVDRPRNTDGVTPIFKAACLGLITIAQHILGRNPNLSVQKCGYSPLHAAAFFGQLGLVQLLLEHGANPDLLDKDGCTAAEVSGRRGYDSVARILETSQGFVY